MSASFVTKVRIVSIIYECGKSFVLIFFNEVSMERVKSVLWSLESRRAFWEFLMNSSFVCY